MDSLRIEQTSNLPVTKVESKLFKESYTFDRTGASELRAKAVVNLTDTENKTPTLDSGIEHSRSKPPDWFDKIYMYGKEVCDEGKQIAHDHPWLTGTLGTAAIIAASSGKLSKLFAAEKDLSEVARAMERTSVLEKVGVVARPQISELPRYDALKTFEIASPMYRSALYGLQRLPTHYSIGETVNADTSIAGVAKRILEERSPFTDERITAESINKEAERLRGLNPNFLDDKTAKELLIYDIPAISKLGEVARSRFIPKESQVLFWNGVDIENLDWAYSIQRKMPMSKRAPIGQILVKKKLATKSQVDDSFEQLNKLKTMLSNVQIEVFGK